MVASQQGNQDINTLTVSPLFPRFLGVLPIDLMEAEDRQQVCLLKHGAGNKVGRQGSRDGSRGANTRLFAI